MNLLSLLTLVLRVFFALSRGSIFERFWPFLDTYAKSCSLDVFDEGENN